MIAGVRKISVLSLLFLFLFCLFLVSCSNFSLSEELGLASLNSTLSIIPVSATIAVNDSLTFSAAGGAPPYVFSIVSGPGSVDSETGFYTAPAVPGTAQIAVQDVVGVIRSVSVLIADPTLNPLSLIPSAVTISTNDVYFFVSLGGIPPYTYTVTAGSGSINPATGEFHAPGIASSSTIEVKDAADFTDSADITILEGLVIIPQTVSVPANNNVAFSASGGTAPYSFVMESGTGSIDSGGFYTASGSTGTDEVRVTDNFGNSRIATVTITAPQPLNISPSSFIILTGDNFSFSATGGTPSYTYGMVSGSGSITPVGDYTASGVPGIDVLRVTDSLGLTADAIVRVVNIGPLTISPLIITVEQDDSFTFSSFGGTPQYSYSVITGSGFVNSSTGEYTAPITLGTETVRVTDASLSTSDATINVAPAAPTNLNADGTDPDPKLIELSWTDNATGEEGFKIERKLSGGVYTEIAIVGANVEFYADADPGDPLSPNVPYSYRIRAFILAGPVYSGYSNDDFDIPNS